jgi:hypothetical protein
VRTSEYRPLQLFIRLAYVNMVRAEGKGTNMESDIYSQIAFFRVMLQ